MPSVERRHAAISGHFRRLARPPQCSAIARCSHSRRHVCQLRHGNRCRSRRNIYCISALKCVVERACVRFSHHAFSIRVWSLNSADVLQVTAAQRNTYQISALKFGMPSFHFARPHNRIATGCGELLPRPQARVACSFSARAKAATSLFFLVNSCVDQICHRLASCTLLLPHPLKAAATSPIATGQPHSRTPQATPALPSSIAIACRRSSHGNRPFPFKPCATRAQDVSFLFYNSPMRVLFFWGGGGGRIKAWVGCGVGW